MSVFVCVCVPRCADVAPVGSCELQDLPAVMEVVASSQGSPINPPDLMLLLPHHPDGLGVADEACASATTTPASRVTRASCWFLIFHWPLVAPWGFTDLTGWMVLWSAEELQVFHFGLYWTYAQSAILLHHMRCDWGRQARWHWMWEMGRLQYVLCHQDESNLYVGMTVEPPNFFLPGWHLTW